LVFVHSLGPRRRVGCVLRSKDQLYANPLRGGALGEINTLVVVRDTAADDLHLRRFELAEESILIRYAGAHGIDHVHSYDHLLRWGSRGREEEGRCETTAIDPRRSMLRILFSRMIAKSRRFGQSPPSSFGSSA
jgi:hypothetical protein